MRWITSAAPVAAGQAAERHGHDRVPVAFRARDRHRGGLLPQRCNFAAGRRDGGVVGTAPAWFALLTMVLVPLVMSVMRAEQPMPRLRAGLGRPGPWSPVLLLVGIAASAAGLARLAIGGFAPEDMCQRLSWPPAPPAWSRPCSPAALRPKAPNRERCARTLLSSHPRPPEATSAPTKRTPGQRPHC